MAASVSVACVVVTYQSNDVLADCLRSIPEPCAVIVVDQPSSESPLEIVATCRPDAQIIRPLTNRGFGAGCNLGASLVDEAVTVFLNPDARLSDGSIDALAMEVTKHGGTLVGPRILDAGGNEVTCARLSTSVSRDLADLLLPRQIRPGFLDNEVSGSDPVYETGGEVDYVQGACMAIGTTVFRESGGFNESMFLYGEEEWLALAIAPELNPRLLPSASIHHDGHHSTDQVAAFAVEQLFRSRVFIYREIYGAPKALVGVVLNAVALIGLLLTHRIRKRVGYRSAEDALWCRSALRGLAHGVLSRSVEPPRSA